MMLIDNNAVKNDITEKHIRIVRLLLLQTVREKPLSSIYFLYNKSLFNKFCEIPEQIVRPRYMSSCNTCIYYLVYIAANK